MKFIQFKEKFVKIEDLGVITRDIIAIIALIIIILFGTFYYQNGFNYELDIYDYYACAYILASITFLYSAISIFCSKNRSDQTDLLLIPGILYLLYSLHNGKEYAIVFSSIYLLFFIIKSVSMNFLVNTIYLIIGIYLIQCIATFYNNVHGIENNYTYKNTGVFSIYCSIFIPSAYYLVSRHFFGKNLYIVFGIYLLTILSIIVCLKSRTAIISLMIVFIIPYFIKWITSQQGIIKTLIIILSFLLFLIGAYILFHIKLGSSLGRILMIEVSFKHLKEYFWTGTGFGNFTYSYPNWQSDFFTNTAHYNKGYFLHAGETYVIFNEFLQLFLSVGAILFSFLLFLVIRFFCVKKRSDLLDVIKITFLIILSCSLTYYTLHINIVLIMIAFYAALAFKILFSDRPVQQKNRNFLRLVNLLISILTLYVSYDAHEKYKAVEEWSIIKNTDESGGDVGIKIQEIENQLQNDGKFLADYGNYLYEHQSDIPRAVYYIEKAHCSFINLESKETLAYLYLEQKDYRKAINAFEWLVNYIPSKFRYRLELIELYLCTDNQDKALQLANNTLDMPIKIYSSEVDDIKHQVTLIKNKLENHNKLN